jgi:glycosyltransferase involved in cell wall biosynthesis
MTENDKKYLIENGITTNLFAIPTFIPPEIKEREIKEISKDVWNFINNHKPLISANASSIVFYNDQDLYGIDMCIDLCTNLKKHYPQIGFIFSIPCIKDNEYFEKMKQRIIENDIEQNFIFNIKSSQLYPIIMKSDVFVRPTNTDGDAISLREALYFKIPTVASNIVPRPESTKIFRNRDIEDFILKVKEILDNYNLVKEKIKKKDVENNAEKILEIYQKMTNLNIMTK